MPTTIGNYAWSTSRGNPSAGLITLASDPLFGYANTLRVHQTDSEGNDRSAILANVDDEDALLIVTSGLIQSAITGTPVDSGAFYSFPITIGLTFDEPANEADTYLLYRTGTAWPDITELAMVLNIAPDSAVTAWTTTLTRILASAIDKVKGDVGIWDEINDVPSERHAQAALRMAELLSQRPELTADQLGTDPAYTALISGKRRRFGIA